MKVYIARCPSYDQQIVEAALRESLRAFSDTQALIEPGQRVILKVNLLQAQPPEKAVTTHPAVVAAVAKWVRELGATPIIADSPGGLFTVRRLRHVYRATGMVAAAEEGGALLNYDVRTVQLPYPEGHLLKMVDVMRAVVEADAIISLPKLKTHGLTLFTGATKNLFGTVPGLTKAGYHTKLPTVDKFSEMLIDILSCHKPVLTVMDAVVGMEGDGPSGGNPRHVGLLLTSTDGVALDVVATSIIGMSPLEVPPIAAAVRRGLTSGHVEDIEILGSLLSEVQIADFKRPRTGSSDVSRLPRFIRAWANRLLLASPQAGSKCIACGVCVENCPMQAITIVNGRAHMDLARCIRCYCCHELCPENAVELHQPLLGRLVTR